MYFIVKILEMTDKENKKKNPGISLVVQWLGLCFHCQGPWDWGN